MATDFIVPFGLVEENVVNQLKYVNHWLIYTDEIVRKRLRTYLRNTFMNQNFKFIFNS